MGQPGGKHSQHDPLDPQRTRDRVGKSSFVSLKFAKLYSALAPKGREISFPLRRADLAKFSGTTIESAVRCLTRLKGQGIIAVAGRDIRILKPEALVDFTGDEPDC